MKVQHLKYITKQFPSYEEFPDSIKKQIHDFLNLRGTGLFSFDNEKYFLAIVNQGLYKRPLSRFLRAVRLYNRKTEQKLILLFGREHQIVKEFIQKKIAGNTNRIEYWTQRGYSEAEARKIISEKNSRGVQHYVNKGYTLEEARGIVERNIKSTTEAIKKSTSKMSENERKQKYGFTEDKMKYLYGETEGSKRYRETRKKMSYSLANLTKKYGEKIGQEKYLEKLNNVISSNPMCIEYWLSQGLNHQEAEESRALYSRSWKRFSMEYCRMVYGEKAEEIMERRNKIWLENLNSNNDMAALIEKRTRHLKDRTTNMSVSKSSINCFRDSLEYLDALGIKYYCGVGQEWFLRDEEGIVFYDLCIPHLNVIVEFNGVLFHAHPQKPEQERHLPINPFTKENWFDLKKKDVRKMKLAESHGFDTLVVWEDDKEASRKCLDFIKARAEELQNAEN